LAKADEYFARGLPFLCSRPRIVFQYETIGGFLLTATKNYL
jgi:hypothetical protein